MLVRITNKLTINTSQIVTVRAYADGSKKCALTMTPTLDARDEWEDGSITLDMFIDEFHALLERD